MTITYETDNPLRMSEEDNYEEGCNPETRRTTIMNISFRASTINDLLHQICGFHGVDINDIELNACDEVGRVDIGTIETIDGLNATKRDIERWKANEIKLWAVTYTYYIDQVERTPVSLDR